MPYKSGDLVTIATLDDSVEIGRLAALFEEKGIRFVMDPLGSSPYAGVFETQKGLARLKVFQEDAEAARELLASSMEIFADEDYEEERESTE